MDGSLVLSILAILVAVVNSLYIAYKGGHELKLKRIEYAICLVELAYQNQFKVWEHAEREGRPVQVEIRSPAMMLDEYLEAFDQVYKTGRYQSRRGGTVHV